MLSSSFEKDIIKHANAYPEEEVCGFVLHDYVRGAYIKKSTNNSPNKRESFSVNPSEYFQYKSKENLIGIYHSHPTSGEDPSDVDLKNSRELGIPYLIYSLVTKRFFLHYPETYEPKEYIGRPYIKGFFECTSIAKDYYKKEKKLSFLNWVSNHWPPEEYREVNTMVLDLLQSRGQKIDIQQIQEGDVLIFKIGKRIHCGIYIGGDEFIHQLVGKFSSKEMLDDQYKRFLVSIYRYSQNDILA